MRIINKYILSSILKILIVSLFLCTFLLLSVDLFINLDSYIQNKISWFNIIKVTILYIPEAILLVFPPSILFTITYFLSQLYANNEMISLLSSGISKKKVIFPILILVFFITIFAFLFEESVSLNTKVERTSLKKELFRDTSELNNKNITLRDRSKNYIIYSSFYKESKKTLYNVIVVKLDENNQIEYRIDSPFAFWNEINKNWIFNEANISFLNEKENIIRQEYKEKEENATFNLDPNLFRNLSNDIETLEFFSALNYLKQQKGLNITEYFKTSTDFYNRVFSSFTIFVMASIALLLNYKNKKNVFLFAIFNSIIIAVVYYVTRMLFQIISRQGLILPIYGVFIPYVLVLILTAIINRFNLYQR